MITLLKNTQIDGEAKVIPIQCFENKSKQLKDFFRTHRNIKTRLVLVCLMEKQDVEKIKVSLIQNKAYNYFQSETHINLEATV